MRNTTPNRILKRGHFNEKGKENYMYVYVCGIFGIVGAAGHGKCNVIGKQKGT
jgi:hypothetical protein